MSAISQGALKTIKEMQLNEATEHVIYTNIASFVKDEKNKEILIRIGAEEFAHSKIWQKYTGEEAKVNKFKVSWYTFLARFFGYTFAIKLMENGEESANNVYERLASQVPDAEKIAQDEQRHEGELIEMLDEEALQYVGSMVLGLNDALVELTGTLAGLSFALQNTKIIALSGLITGISATFSMAASQYLSERSDGKEDALKSSVYTGIAYSLTVVLLVLPYLLFPADKYLYALISMLIIVVVIIFAFTYYISVAKDLNFKQRFFEMAAISLGVAMLSFVVGILVKKFLGIDI